MKAAIHALKYDRLHPAARGLGQMLAEAIAQLAPKRRPRCWWFPCRCTDPKYAQRGFNQARSLAVYALGSLAQESHPAVAAHAGLQHPDATARH
jgi:predicted amidophosphoribosyltransferase